MGRRCQHTAETMEACIAMFLSLVHLLKTSGHKERMPHRSHVHYTWASTDLNLLIQWWQLRLCLPGQLMHSAAHFKSNEFGTVWHKFYQDGAAYLVWRKCGIVIKVG